MRRWRGAAVGSENRVPRAHRDPVSCQIKRRRCAAYRSTTTISRDGIHDGTPAGSFMGWSVIEAEDTNAAIRLMEDHPFISQGGILQLSEPV